MNVLFVTETKNTEKPFRDSSTRHRCYTMAEALHLAGHLADVTTLDNVELINLARYDVVSVLKPTASRKLLAILRRCKKLNIRTVADLDSLDFDPQLAEELSQSHRKVRSETAIRRMFMLRKLALQDFDEVSVANEELAKARREIAPSQSVYVVPNTVSNFWLSSHDHLSLKTNPTQRIGYFPETRGLDDDFTVAAQGLSRYLQSGDERKLFITGPMSIAEDTISAAKVERGPWVDHIDLPETLVQCRVNLIPHRATRMNFAQSHASFIEAAAFGVPTIASPNRELESHNVQGLFIANDDQEWHEHLESLADEKFYQHCQQSLYEYVRQNCRAEDSAKILIKQWTANKENTNNETTTRLSAAS